MEKKSMMDVKYNVHVQEKKSKNWLSSITDTFASAPSERELLRRKGNVLIVEGPGPKHNNDSKYVKGTVNLAATAGSWFSLTWRIQNLSE